MEAERLSAGSFDLLFRGAGEFRRLDRQLLGQLTAAQHFHAVQFLADDLLLEERLGVHDVAVFKHFQPLYIDFRVFGTEHVIKSAFRNPAV